MQPIFPHFLHGGDYNPDQWLDRPDILERDVQLMQEAHVNAVSVGIFSLTLMEPEEGGTSSNGWTGSSTGCGAAHPCGAGHALRRASGLDGEEVP